MEHKEQITLEYIGDWFDARGMKRLSARDYLMTYKGRYLRYYSDIWKAKDGRILVRFYNRGSEAENEAYEIKGTRYDDIPHKELDTEAWIPQCVIDRFDDWVASEMPFEHEPFYKK